MAYIDVEKLLKKLTTSPDGTKIPNVDCDNFPTKIDLRLLKRIILRQPTADVVEVVRCKDCNFYDCGECWHDNNMTYASNSDGDEYNICFEVSEEHFCSYGTPKERGGEK